MTDEQHLSILPEAAPLSALKIGARTIPIEYVRNHRARRYIIRLRPGGVLRATVPAFGSKRQAYAFAQREQPWIERQLHKFAHARSSPSPVSWTEGTTFLFRGEPVTLRRDSNAICFGDQRIECGGMADLQARVEAQLFSLARRELIPRTVELAKLHQLQIRRVSIRSQRSRWGSCSPRRTISLNWRLIQMPGFVSDYIILHELMHLREMNHSPAFWSCVAEVCPDYRAAERWIKQHSAQFRPDR